MPIGAAAGLWSLLTGMLEQGRLIAQGRAESRRRVLDKYVVPIYELMEVIHADYIDGFQEVRVRIANNAPIDAALVDFLLQRRRIYDTRRELAGELAKAVDAAERKGVGGERWDEVKAFAGAVEQYFLGASDVAGASWYTEFIGIVESSSRIGLSSPWHMDGFSGNPARDLLTRIDDNLNSGLPQAFSPINQHYAKLRVLLS